MSQFFTSGGQSIGVSASASNEYSGLISFRTDWFDLLQPKGLFKESSLAAQFKSIISFVLSLLYNPILTSVYDDWKTMALTVWIYTTHKVMTLLFNTA